MELADSKVFMEAMTSEMRCVMRLELEQVHEWIDQMESANKKQPQNVPNLRRRERVQPREVRVEDEEPYGAGFGPDALTSVARRPLSLQAKEVDEPLTAEIKTLEVINATSHSLHAQSSNAIVQNQKGPVVLTTTPVLIHVPHGAHVVTIEEEVKHVEDASKASQVQHGFQASQASELVPEINPLTHTGPPTPPVAQNISDHTVLALSGTAKDLGFLHTSYAGANRKLSEITVKTHAGPTPTPPTVLKRYDFSALPTSDALATVYCSNQEGPQQAPFDARQPGPHLAKLANPTTPSSDSAQQLTAPSPLG
ncbi:hypothetical protein F0562_015301 [Nyssa sinensis]|uniref:Uncharacterized protein n=1 Tax=Nyssa sinensis TaxID=561372 RepID=A0A5J4ZJ40_9ASTE|nr:hypothetical protein F0562_015301 [Nyssa sinensis]